MRLSLRLIFAILIVWPLASEAMPVIVDGKEWRQVIDTYQLSWDEVSTVCNTSTGACTGSLGSVGFTGWNRATIYEVGNLFMSLTPHNHCLYLYKIFHPCFAGFEIWIIVT